MVVLEILQKLRRRIAEIDEELPEMSTEERRRPIAVRDVLSELILEILEIANREESNERKKTN